MKLVHELKCKVHRRIVDSLAYFMLANTDDNASTYAVEAVQLEWAIEHLLNPKSGQKGFAKKVTSVLGDMVRELASASKRANGRWTASAEENSCLIIREWANEFYFLRNKITHGDDLALYEWRWGVWEHCVFAAWLYPLLVKLLLVENGDYELTDDDIASLHSVGKLLSTEKWTETWFGILNDEGRRLRTRRSLKEKLCGT